jgi:hypothetical protein
MLTQEYLHTILDYDSETGDFTWKWREDTSDTFNGRFAYQQAGTVRWCNAIPHIVIGINRRLYYAHRLAWIYMHREEPLYIDHINRNSVDNRIVNLRSVTQSENMLNSCRQFPDV